MTAPGPVRTWFTVDPWDPSYGVAFNEEVEGGLQPGGPRADAAGPGGELTESTAELDLDLEVPAAAWRAVSPDPSVALPGTLLFLDGVRRIDAWVWVHNGGPQPAPGLAASFAAGIVCCDGRATVAEVAVERGLFTGAPDAADIATGRARYVARPAGRGGAEKLSLAVAQRLSEAEVELAVAFRARRGGDGDLLVVDGPLRGRTHLDGTVGYIKTHHSSYLPAPQATVVAALAPGQRTPVFAMGTSWRRTSWYLRLPHAARSPWSGVVRLECSADLPPAAAARLADQTAVALPPLASAPQKDPRAPQNLVPIGGLERELRHRLGDRELLYRALRAAAGS